MRKLPLCILSLLPLIAVGAINFGDTLETVIAQKGQPISKLERNSITVVTYADAVIRLENGKVVSLKKPEADYATSAIAPKPQPQGSRKSSVAGTTPQWATDYSSALTAASGTNRKIFLFFTGSDWCGWCKRLDAEILTTPEFLGYALENLILVKLDFPKHTPQPSQIKSQNTQLARQYHLEGFPTIVVLNSSGTAIGRTGYQQGGPGPFIDQLKGY